MNNEYPTINKKKHNLDTFEILPPLNFIYLA